VFGSFGETFKTPDFLSQETHMLTLSGTPPVKTRSDVRLNDSGWPLRSVELLTEVDRLLRVGRPREAVDVIGDSYLTDPWTANALAVCHLRLGDSIRALYLLRYIATDHTSRELRDDVPTVFKTNLATALLANGNIEEFLRVLDKLKREEHPSVRRLEAVVARWEHSLSTWNKFLWNTVGLVPRPPSLDFPLGDLRVRPVEVPDSVSHLRHGLLRPEVGARR
jgi:hypothetical protein